jgi:hypothetical protein
VIDFFERDDVSSLTAGKKQTKTYKKDKRQIRYLNDSMKILFAKFHSEYPDIPMSYSRFCRLRPFWVLVPQLKDCETCIKGMRISDCYLSLSLMLAC